MGQCQPSSSSRLKNQDPARDKERRTWAWERQTIKKPTISLQIHAPTSLHGWSVDAIKLILTQRVPGNESLPTRLQTQETLTLQLLALSDIEASSFRFKLLYSLRYVTKLTKLENMKNEDERAKVWLMGRPATQKETVQAPRMH